MSVAKEITQQKINLYSLKKTDVNIIALGHGLVGGALIKQILATQESLLERKDLNMKIIAVANSTKLLLAPNGINRNWLSEKQVYGTQYSVQTLIDFVALHHFKNVIVVDNTADDAIVNEYATFVKAGFHLISSNKKGNTQSLDFYNNLRQILYINNKNYLYETNVGAGLPLIDTISLLHASGENITKIRGVFSGSLSYIFNAFGNGDLSFSEVLGRAVKKGFTEPDPREDLNGNDVARKLLILARELDLHNELEDVKVESLVPESLRNSGKEEFLNALNQLDIPFKIKKVNCPKDKVLRYVAELSGDLSKNDGAVLEVKLVPVLRNSAIGQLSGSDTIFEIYTKNYGKNPIVIQGAGAGAEVTARGVFGDILRLSSKLN